jgi:hypothetical protein
MFTRETLLNFGKSLENGEKEAFLAAIPSMREETRGEISVILNETIKEAGFGAVIPRLDKEWRRFVPANASSKLNVVRHEAQLP